MINLNTPVLVLSSSYEAVQICSLKRAVLLTLAGKAHAVEHGDSWLHSPSMQLAAPEVIRLHRYIRTPYEDVPFSRKNILMRDGYQCQYCGARRSGDELTIDHVVPLSRGGRDTWTNVAAACRLCNNRKGSKLLDECGMQLLNPPRRPTSLTFLHIMRQQGERRHVWRKYLFFEQQIDLVSIGT